MRFPEHGLDMTASRQLMFGVGCQHMTISAPIIFGIYLCFAIKSGTFSLSRMILGARQATARISSVSGKTGKRAFRDAAMVTVLNPKSIGFFVAFVPQFVELGQPLFVQFLIMVITFVTLGTLNALAYAMLASHLRDRLKKPHLLAWMQRMGGVVLIGMASFTAALRRN